MMIYGAAELAASFRTVRSNTLLAAHDIPAEKYDFSPADGFMTVEKLLTHIAYGHAFQYQLHAIDKLSHMGEMDWHTLMADMQAKQAVSRTKDEVIALLEETGETFAGFLDGLSDDFLAERVAFPEEFEQPPKTRFEMLMSVKEHEMHHRGQLMVVQRILGIVPHLTRQREARMKEMQEQGAD